MRTHHGSRRWPLVAWLLLLLGHAWAQEVPPEYEENVEDWVLVAERRESPFYVGRFQDLYAPDLAQGRAGPVLEHMLSLFEALDWQQEEPRQAQILRRARPFLAQVRSALATASQDGRVDTLEEQNAFLAALTATGTSPRALVLDTSGTVPVYFAGTSDELRLYEWEPDGEHVHLLLAAQHVREWRLLEHSITTLVARLYELVAQENVSSLEGAVTRWDNFLERGYSQMPWESWINGHLIPPPRLGPDSDRLGPPDHQWVLLHPSFGLEFDAFPLDEARVKESLQIELLGHVWYHGRDLDQYWGLSAALSLREDLDPGIGLLVHLRRAWNLGITWHGVEDDPFLFLSVDLFRFARTRAGRYEAAYARLREQL